MSELLLIFLSAFVIAFSGAITPGPLLTVAIRVSLEKGFIAGPLLIAGHGIAEFSLLVGLLLGIAPFVQGDKIFSKIEISGGIILFIMAFGMLRSKPILNAKIEGKIPSNIKLVICGAIMSVINPYWIIWWATIGLGYILHSWHYGILGLSFFFCGHILADIAWYSAVTFAMGKGKHLMSDNFYKTLINTCSIFLVIFSICFFYGGLRKIVNL